MSPTLPPDAHVTADVAAQVATGTLRQAAQEYNPEVHARMVAAGQAYATLAVAGHLATIANHLASLVRYEGMRTS